NAPEGRDGHARRRTNGEPVGRPRPSSPWAEDRDQRRHGAGGGRRRGCVRCRRPRARGDVPGRGARARAGDLALDRRGGRTRRPRAGREPARAATRRAPLLRPPGRRGGDTGLRGDRRPARLRPDRDPVPGARGARARPVRRACAADIGGRRRYTRRADPLTRSSEAGKELHVTTHVPEDATARLLLDGEAIHKSLSRSAHEIIARSDDLDRVALVGIQSRGAPLASRLRRLVEERSGTALQVGALDITFHRDDVHVRDGGRPPGRQPIVRATSISFPIEGMTVVLVDDVLYTGRTIRAAIDALLDFGRPARVQLAVLVDRGHRELPIRPDYVGKNLPTGRDERIQVELVEIDERDG